MFPQTTNEGVCVYKNKHIRSTPDKLVLINNLLDTSHMNAV